MDLQNMTFFKAASTKMRWLAQRQAVIAQNIANADTPNYMPSDLKPLRFSELVDEGNGVSLMRTNPAHRTRGSEDTRLATTNPAHMTPVPEGKAKVAGQRRPFETSIDKNGVILEEQMAKMDMTRGEYDKVVALFQKNVSLINIALNKK